MKKTKVIGILLMSSALLLQASYAIGSINMPVIQGSYYKVDLVKTQVSEASLGVSVEVGEVKGNIIPIHVGNMYPGASFDLGLDFKNEGDVNIVLDGIDLNVKNKDTAHVEGNQTYNEELMSLVIGSSADGTIYGDWREYKAYLDSYGGIEYTLAPGEIFPLRLTLHMNEEITDRQNQVVQFEIVVRFAQAFTESGEGDGESGESGNPGDIGTPGAGGETELEDEMIPGGAIGEEIVPIETDELILSEDEMLLEDEMIPGGPINDEVIVAEDIITLEDEEVPGGMLPKTGGIAPILVYIMGILLFGTGFIFYRKKEEGTSSK